MYNDTTTCTPLPSEYKSSHRMVRDLHYVLEANQLIYEVQDLYQKECQAIDDNFQLIYQQCERLAEKIGCEIAMPRITGRQQHRSKPLSARPLDYFKRTVAIPFLDFIVSSLEELFSISAVIATSLLSLSALFYLYCGHRL